MLKIHFLNVGHCDCIIIENFDTGRNTVIDINRSKEMDNSSKKEVYGSFRGLASHFHDTLILESGNYNTPFFFCLNSWGIIKIKKVFFLNNCKRV